MTYPGSHLNLASGGNGRGTLLGHCVVVRNGGGGAVITNGLLCNADELQSAVKKNARPCITIRRPRRGLLLPATLYYIESFPFLQ